jgi:hypothetical protein
LGFPQFVAEAHAARMDIEGVSMPSIGPRARGRISGAIVEAAKFLLEIARRDLRTDVEL